MHKRVGTSVKASTIKDDTKALRRFATNLWTIVSSNLLPIRIALTNSNNIEGNELLVIAIYLELIWIRLNIFN